MLLTKTKVISYHDFMDGSYKLKAKEKTIRNLHFALLGASLVYSVLDPFGGTIASASVSGAITEGVQDRIIRAFDPIIQLAQGCSYPVAFLMLVLGGIMIMLGQKTQGLRILKYTAIGYIVIQFAPSIMAILAEVGKAISQS